MPAQASDCRHRASTGSGGSTRPDAHGPAQLIWALAGREITRIVSSPLARCVESVVPIAESRCLVVESRWELEPDVSLDDLLTLLADLPDTTLACTHREVFENTPRLGRDVRKGGAWVLERSGSELVPAFYLAPPAAARAPSATAPDGLRPALGQSASERARRRALDTRVDVVPDPPDGLEILPGRILESPVLVALAGVDRARVAAAHRHDDVGGAHDLVGERLGELLAHVEADLGHRLDHGRVDLVGRIAACGAHVDPPSERSRTSPAAIWLRPALWTQTKRTREAPRYPARRSRAPRRARFSDRCIMAS